MVGTEGIVGAEGIVGTAGMVGAEGIVGAEGMGGTVGVLTVDDAPHAVRLSRQPVRNRLPARPSARRQNITRAARRADSGLSSGDTGVELPRKECGVVCLLICGDIPAFLVRSASTRPARDHWRSA